MSAFASEKYLSDADAFMASAAADDGAVAGDAGGAENGGDGADNETDIGDRSHVHGTGDTPLLADQDEEDCFSVAKGNVAFSSAVDGWAFRPDIFARIYAAKLGCSAVSLQAALWGDWYYAPKTKRIVSKKGLAAAMGPQAVGRAKPLFVQLALEPLWQLYAAAETETSSRSEGGSNDGAKSLADMALSLGVAQQVPARELNGPDRRAALRAVLRAWLPLSSCILDMVVQQLPSPRASAAKRMPVLSARCAHLEDSQNDKLDASLAQCDAREAPTVAFVSKMFAAPPGALPASSGSHVGQQQEVFLAFGRVFSGTLRPGDSVAVLPPGWTPTTRGDSESGDDGSTAVDEEHAGISSNGNHTQSMPHTAVIGGVYLMMGRSLHLLPGGAPAGSVVAISGLDTAVLKCATLVTAPTAQEGTVPPWLPLRPFKGMFLQAAPVVRVALEPACAADVPHLLRGLRLLNRADPSVEVAVGDGGETLLGVAGEVHLERCLKDLRERFARVEVTASAPLVSFRESTAGDGWPDKLASLLGPASRASLFAVSKEVRTPNGLVAIKAVAAPLPELSLSVLDKCAGMIAAQLARETGSDVDARVASGETARGNGHHGEGGSAHTAATVAAELKERLAAAEASAIATAHGGEPTDGAANAVIDAMSRAWALGPKQCGPNILLASADALFLTGSDAAPDAPAAGYVYPLATPTAASALGLAEQKQHEANGMLSFSDTQQQPQPPALLAQLAASVLTGFQLACERGPLCDEPLWGCVFDLRCELRSTDATMLSKGAPGAGDDAASAGGEECASPAATAQAAGFSGQVIDCARKAVRQAVEAASPRLVEQFYLCVVTTTAEALGGTYTVLHRRRAIVLAEVLREGSGAFVVTAHVPVAQCFGLADELRQHTQGAAAPQLVLSHWARLEEDPQWVPTTEEEQEEWGSTAGGKLNVARRTVDAVRRRKGLPVEEKIVASATKQRTQARKK